FKIITQVISESIVLTLSAGWLGLAAGVGVVQLIGNATSNAEFPIMYNPMISFNMGLLALGILIISGIIAGLMPAYRAVKMKPIEALRTEK
ncbi:MAG TPA: ABC transporter permease, partial [Salinivirgaceae bacterium]|nr:ABC transporter permease [Salinivirgaceae bacterium]